MLNTSTSSSHWYSRPAWLEHSQPPWAPWHCDWAVSHVSEHLVRPSSQGIPWILLILWLMIWLVVYLPLWKMIEFVNWDDEIPWIPNICSKHFQTTNQWIILINSIVLNDVLLISMACSMDFTDLFLPKAMQVIWIAGQLVTLPSHSFSWQHLKRVRCCFNRERI